MKSERKKENWNFTLACVGLNACFIFCPLITVLRQKEIILLCQCLFEHIPFAHSTMPTLGSVPLLFLPFSFRPHPLPQEDTWSQLYRLSSRKTFTPTPRATQLVSKSGLIWSPDYLPQIVPKLVQMLSQFYTWRLGMESGTQSIRKRSKSSASNMVCP